ncbi:hypothetical protein K505DRAFT_419597 [Melanomma pulvis-pyrius CBS 109.77]|uniref:Uncharacterized protein n=1 Tax=Melanomma pulvis-pyrius CBS 109.77 TaxID=1314802 RepID=A0A6A6X3H8_9PLEO|nr:hypothetical protein K505DRAFT_419597 [Melanomma pulvis-pyrius CBS 109.77]
MPSPVSCTVTNVQQGSQRFPHEPNRPRLKTWRCELTALSKVYNVYFVACNDAIHVYQPSFPDQSLSNEPFVLHIPVTSPGLLGAVHYENSHAINRLQVEFLGREEIVLVACDDGDVVGYRVHEIQRAIEGGGKSLDQIRVFLHRNVGKSAWGLAVHREARLIAIGANTGQITVIAYALASSPEVDYSTSDDISYPRQQEQILTRTVGSNIPSISFDNSGGDPSGHWMFSSTIKGNPVLWGLDPDSTPLPAREINLGYCNRYHVCTCEDLDSYPHAVWATIFLDPQSFRHSDHLVDALGVVPTSDNSRFWEINSLSRQRDISQNGDDATASDVIEYDQGEEEMAINASDEDIQMDGDESQHTMNQANSANDSLFVPEVDMASPSADGSVDNEDDEDSQDEEIEWASFYDLHQPVSLKHHYCETKTKDGFSVPARQPPCVVVTKNEIYLLQRPLDPNADDLPIITMPNPLCIGPWQQLSHDRLCYTAQIPELGIFIVASPGGRAGIFSLTYFEGDYSDVFGFRLDHLLPFERQIGELGLGEAGNRLVGIAVGPVQGMLDPPAGAEMGERTRSLGARRWRLMMTYDNHTVLSYELGKYPEREDMDDAPGLADLVV